MTTSDLSVISQEFHQFTQQFKTLLLATANSAGIPEVSYAPYVAYQNEYYIFISELATHTRNLTQTHRCSVMFIEDENQAHQLFARKRATLQCDAVEITRQMPSCEPILQLFDAQFGKFFGLLRQLPDFHLYRLSPQSASYIAGFGKAYSLNGQELNQVAWRRS
ncbi:HugZ family protein [Thiofilum flexile]|uniref:HugZ family pyridoxamine 5'-phosphate oxidase n=1 Tax=Thiofilum flexile TaxID=125627 RepID=UPI0003702D83|nr:pyridoxamine 5'-phosphate oxidase family protein [Thiofilum flexile]